MIRKYNINNSINLYKYHKCMFELGIWLFETLYKHILQQYNKDEIRKETKFI